MHEHAYLVGKELMWVKEKVRHGNFLPWVEKNLWFQRATAVHFMRFAEKCDKAGKLLAYHPNKCITVGNSAPSFPPGKYQVIYADPPWQYDNSGFDESAESQYPTMPLEDICGLKKHVETASTYETVLFLWTTNPLVVEALAVISLLRHPVVLSTVPGSKGLFGATCAKTHLYVSSPVGQSSRPVLMGIPSGLPFLSA